MPKIILKQTFKNLKGEEIQIIEEGKKTGFVLTLGEVLANVVLSPHNDRKGFRPLDAVQLGRKFYNDNEVELTEAEFVQMKELVETSDLMPIVSGQVLEMFSKAK